MDGVRSFMLVGLIIAACGRDQTVRGIGWVMVLVSTAIIMGTMVLEAIARMVG